MARKMTTVLHALGVLALMGAGVSFWFSAVLWRRPGLDVGEVQPSLHVTRESGRRPGYGAISNARSSPPLIVQAEAFARYLRPSETPKTPPAEASTGQMNPPVLPIRPPNPRVTFRLRATSVYASQPSRSMALIAEAGSGEGNGRWVKEGTQVGHFVVHEIGPNGIIYRDGDQLREMGVEPAMGPPSIVQDVRAGPRRVATTVEPDKGVSATPVRPNSAAPAEN